MRRAIAFLLAATGLLAGCAGGGDETSGVERVVDPALVAFEAEWQCERERHAFDELEDLTTRLEVSRAEAGISAEAYEAFQEQLGDDPDLRAELLAAYRARCG